MKKIKSWIIGILSLVSAASYAQTASMPVIPLQDSSGTMPNKKLNSSETMPNKKLNSSPMPMPKTGNPSEDTLIRDQRGANMSPDSSKYNKNTMKKGRRRGGSGELDTTGTRRKNN